MRNSGTAVAFALLTAVAVAPGAMAATYVYVSNADDGDISTYTIQADGTLQPGPRVKAAATVMPMVVSPDRKLLYAAVRSKRTGSSIGTLAVDGATGKLTYVGSTPTEKQPRGFQIDSKGRFMVVTGEKSATVSTYAIDAATGALRPIGKYPTGKGANWVEIVNLD